MLSITTMFFYIKKKVTVMINNTGERMTEKNDIIEEIDGPKV